MLYNVGFSPNIIVLGVVILNVPSLDVDLRQVRRTGNRLNVLTTNRNF